MPWVNLEDINPDILKNTETPRSESPEPGWLETIGRSLSTILPQIGRAGAGVVQAVEEASPANVASFPVHAAAMVTEPLKYVGLEGVPDFLKKFAEGIEANPAQWAQFQPVKKAEEAVGMKPVGQPTGEYFGRVAEDWSPKFDSPEGAKYQVAGAVQSLGLNLATAVGAMLSRRPSMALSLMAAQQGFQNYSEVRERAPEVSPGKAMAAGLTYAGAEYWTEKIPLRILIDPTLSFKKRFLLEALAEIPGELVATTVEQGIVDRLTTNPDMTWGEFLKDLKDTAIQTAIATPLQAGAMHGVVKWANSQQKDNDVNRQATDTIWNQPKDVPDFKTPNVNAYTGAEKAFRQFETQLENISIPEAVALKYEVMRDFPELSDRINKVIIEAQGRKLFEPRETVQEEPAATVSVPERPAPIQPVYEEVIPEKPKVSPIPEQEVQEVAPPTIEEAEMLPAGVVEPEKSEGKPLSSNPLEPHGLTVTQAKTNNGKDVWEVSGDADKHKDIIKSLGGRWFKPKNVWSFYDGDPTEKLAKALERPEKPGAAPFPMGTLTDEPSVSNDLKHLVLSNMKTELEQGFNYGMAEENIGEGWERRFIGSTNPSWLQEIAKAVKQKHDQTVGKTEILSVIQKEVSGRGDSMSPKQLKVWNEVEKVMNRHSRDPYYQRAEAEMQGAIEALSETFVADESFGDLEFGPTKEEIAEAARNVVKSEIENGNKETLSDYQAGSGETRGRENARAAPAESKEKPAKPRKEVGVLQPIKPKEETVWLPGIKNEMNLTAQEGEIPVLDTETKGQENEPLFQEKQRPGTEMYSAKEVKDFSSQVDDFVAGKILPGHELTVSNTPPVLRMLGAEQLPLIITQRNTEKALERKHGISPEMFKQLPAQIADPVMVFESRSYPDSLVVMTDLKKDGKTVVVAIHLSNTVDRIEVNEIASVHPRESDAHFFNWINQGLLLYQEKQKSREWFLSRGLQLPKEETAIRGFKDRKRLMTGGLQLPKMRGAAQGSGKRILFKHDLVKWIKEKGEKLSIQGSEFQQPTLADVQEIFKGQDVQQTQDGTFLINTRGGEYLAIFSVDQVDANNLAFNIGYGRNLTRNDIVAGSYKDGVITLSKTEGDKLTLAHESVHFMEDMKILSPSDVATLKGTIKRLSRDGKFTPTNKNDIGGAEDRANFIADQLMNPTEKGLISRIISKIQDFVDRLVNAFGTRTAGGVVRDIKSGKVYWERDGLGRSQGSPNPASPASTVPGPRQEKFQEQVTPSEEEVKGENKGPYFKLKGNPESIQKSIDKTREKLKKSRPAKDVFGEAPPPFDSDAGRIKNWIDDHTYAIVQTIVRMRPKNQPALSMLEKLLKSPEWYDHPIVGKIVRIFVHDRSELYHANFNYLNGTPDGKTVIDKMRTLLKDDPEQFNLLGQLVDEADTVWKRDKDLPLKEQIRQFEKHMREQGATEDTIQIWKDMRDSYDRALDLMTAQMRELIKEIEARQKEGKELSAYGNMLEDLKMALAEMEEWKGFYAPRVRNQGNYVVQGHRKVNGKEEFFRDHRGKYAASTLISKMRREGWTMKEPYENPKLQEDIYSKLKTVDVAKAIETATRNMKEGVVGPERAELAMKFNEDLIQQVSDMIKARGFRSSMIHRNTEVTVKGYNENPLERYVLYTNSTSAGMAKAKCAAMALNELLGEYVDGQRVGGIDPETDHRAYSTAEQYIEEQLRNLDQTDRVIGVAKSIATFKFLGFNLRSLGVNMTAIGTTAPPAILEYALGGKGSLVRITKELAKAGKDYVKVMAGKGLADPEEQEFLEDLKKKGYDDPQYTRDALGALQRVHGKLWGKAMDASMWMFGKSEQFNRGTTMLAAYRLLKEQGIDHQTAMEKAKDASDKAHGIYGKGTLPAWAQGTNIAAKVGQLLYVYSKFGHNYMQMLYDLGFKKQDYKAFAWAMLSPLVVAGGAAFPFRGLIFGIIGSILKMIGWDDDPEKWVWDQVRNMTGRTGEQIGRHGILGAVGIDISSSLSIGVGIPKGIMDLSGAVGGVVEDFGKAGHYLVTGQPLRAAEKTLPAGFANPVRAYRESQEGIVSEKGKKLWDESGKQVTPSAGQTALRTIGFRSAESATVQERLMEAKKEVLSWEEKKKDIYEEFRHVIRTGTQADHRAIVRDVQKFNSELERAGVKGVSRITFDSMRRQIKEQSRPSKKERALLQ